MSQSQNQISVALYRRLLGYLKPLILATCLSVLGFALFAGTDVWFFKVLGRMIDAIESGSTISSAERLNIPLTLILIVVCRGIGSFLGAYFMAFIANNVVHRLRCQIIERFLSLPISFYDRNSAGHLMSIVTFNVTQVSASVSEALKTLVREGAKVILITGTLLFLNWKLTLIIILATPIIALVVQFASKKFRKHSQKIQTSMGDVTHIISETIKGLKVVRTFGAESQVEDYFAEASQRNLKQNLKMAATSSISTPIIQLVVGIALAILIWFAMSPAILATMSAGDFVFFIGLAASILKPIRQLSKVNADIQKGLAAAKSVFDLLDESPEVNHGSYSPKQVEGKIEFKSVSFSYLNNHESTEGLIINNISFTCEPGQTLAIVGKSGSGKSTLVNLLPRFYETNMGQILIDGTPHIDFNLQNLRQQIALVSQQVVLFNGSIRENIAYGALRGVSDVAIYEALKNAHALEFINALPDGIDTKVGDDGTLLSGGQRQRLAIARALLKNAPILILDEATSALDSESESHIHSALDTLMKGRTTFVIAHRLSTIENADIIMVMHEGVIVEKGSHKELLALGQQYAKLHQLQFTES